MTSDGLRAAAARVAELLDQAEPDGDPTPEQRQCFDRAVGALRAGGAELLDTVTPHLWEYYRDIEDAVGTDGLGMPPLADDADIWAHVELPRRPLLMEDGPDAASPCYVTFEGEVPWEPEHGLQLVFDATGAVCRVGPYTGHLTVSPSILAAYPGTVYG